MLRAGDVLDLSPIGAIFRIKKTSKETQGRSFESSVGYRVLPPAAD
jgi:hypothetical protein